MSEPLTLIAVCDAGDSEGPLRAARSAAGTGATVGLVDLTTPTTSVDTGTGHFQIREDAPGVHVAYWAGARPYRGSDISGTVRVLSRRGCTHVIIGAFDGQGKPEHADHATAVMSLDSPAAMVASPFSTDAALAALGIT